MYLFFGKNIPGEKDDECNEEEQHELHDVYFVSGQSDLNATGKLTFNLERFS